jgi:hypothetical protein
MRAVISESLRIILEITQTDYAELPFGLGELLSYLSADLTTAAFCNAITPPIRSVISAAIY